MSRGFYEVYADKCKDVIVASYQSGEEKLVGVFNVGKEQDDICLDILDGEYINLIDNAKICVKAGKMELINKPIIIEV